MRAMAGRVAAAAVVVVTVVVNVVALVAVVRAAPPEGAVDVFVSTHDASAQYFCYKIPYLLSHSSGVLLAFAEARSGTCSDFADTDVVLKRSTDGGKTWGDLQVVASTPAAAKSGDGDDDVTVLGNVPPVEDRVFRSGRIVMPICRNNEEVLVMHSDDAGLTWTEPAVPVVDVEKNNGEESITPGDWAWIGVGPPASLQLQPSGRIVVPGYHTTLFKGDGELCKGHVMLSDDGGDTWYLGDRRFGQPTMTSENQAVQIFDTAPGEPEHILINARTLGTYRVQVESFDGGLTFSDPVRADDALREPVEGCEGSTITVNDGGDTQKLFYSGSNAASLYRQNMSIYTSSDAGTSWDLLSVIDEGATSYSALQQLESGEVGLLYEWSDEWNIIFDPDRISYLPVWSPDDK